MRLAISNIAWDVAEDDAVAALLRRHHIDAIDIAPTKYFPQPENATTPQLMQVREWWSSRGFEITGMQALMFGTSGLNLFGELAIQTAMLAHLDSVCRIGAALGARRLVFGSPGNRDCSGLDAATTMKVAVNFFRRLGDIAAHHGVTICLEPNPRSYKCNFMTTSDETARVVKEVNHSAIRMQFDVGAVTINHEDADAILRQHSMLVAHVHVSEPNLLPIGEGGSDHQRMFGALRLHLPEHIVTIEMLATPREPHVASIERALIVAIREYGMRGPDDGVIAKQCLPLAPFLSLQ